MKKFIYSAYTKAIASVLLIISIVFATLVISYCVFIIESENEITGESIYRMETNFSDSNYLNSILTTPEWAIYNGFQNAYYEENTNDKNKIVESIKEQLFQFTNNEHLNYRIEWNDIVLTNCDAESGDELEKPGFYRYSHLTPSGVSESVCSGSHRNSTSPLDNIEELEKFDLGDGIKVYANIDEKYVEHCKSIWLSQRYIVTKTFTGAFASLLFALLLLAYLICVCGTDRNGEKTTLWVDNIWSEIHLIIIFLSGILGFILDLYWLKECISYLHFSWNIIFIVVGTVTFIACALILASLLSIARNIKSKNFIQSSIVLRILKHFISLFHNKIASMYIALLLIYTAVIGFCGILTTDTVFAPVLAIIIFGVASFLMGFRTLDLNKIKDGVAQIQNGNSAYKIPKLKCVDLNVLAENINDIAKGLDASVAAQVKAERMKTELITNVSHDLKTPITSIISYTELLEKVDNLPEEARDYVKVISKKGNRLKTLTQDLFDISKAQSGNENVVLEKLDAALLINQSLGEHDNEIKKSNLEFCVNVPKDVYILADGRKMSHVISNIISNILKYSLQGTRVFIDVIENSESIMMEFKNIASYRMNFSGEEITGRFVRGDESRTAEGNGLGLAIAKSYTELCGGKFNIVVDGDLFKAIITFKKEI